MRPRIFKKLLATWRTTVPAMERARGRLLWTMGIWGVYAITFGAAYGIVGDSAPTLVTVPVAVTAALWGLRGGLLAGLLNTLLTTLLFNLLGLSGLEIMIRRWPGIVAGFVIGAAIGWLCDLLYQLRVQSRALAAEHQLLLAQIAERQCAENELRHARDELELRVQERTRELVLAYDKTLEGWSHALELRDRATQGHARRVTEITLQLAQAVQVREVDLPHIQRGTLLHDIGKMGIPDRILLKPGELTDEEWIIMRRHPVYAYEMLAPIPYLDPALDIPYSHHERWDGSGYPRGLSGEQIPLFARIFAIVDVWDALRSNRPYRPAWPEDQVRQYLLQQAGKHFDPQIVSVFLNLELRRND